MNLVELSQRIKQQRKTLGLTLDQVAGRTGLTQSVLSKIENFRVTPSLPALVKITEALETTVSELTKGLNERPDITITHRGEGGTIERDTDEPSAIYKSLTHQRAGSLNSLLIALPPSAAVAEAMSHEGEEVLYVLDGKILFEYGEERYPLQKGDSAYFNAGIPHRATNPYKESAEIHCVFNANKNRRGQCPICASKLLFLVSDSPSEMQEGIYQVDVEGEAETAVFREAN